MNKENKQILNFFTKFNEWVNNLEGGNILYRGHADENWELEASGNRRLRKKSISITSQEYVDRLIKHARSNGLGIKEGREIDDLELLADLQHYGAATCLIDFSKNPFIALFFACREHQEKDGIIIAIKSDVIEKFAEVTYEKLEEKINYFFQEEGKIWKWTPPFTQNNRVLAQNSVFLFGNKKTLSPDKELTIKKENKKAIINCLRDKYGITEGSLFSDLAGFAMANAHDKEYTEYSEEDYFKFGVTHIQKQQYEEAIKDYDEAITINPQLAEAYYNRGYAKGMLERYEEAIKDFDKAITINPQYAKAYYNRGYAKDALERYEEAIKDFDKAITINPQLAEAYYNRGLAKRAIGDEDGAREDFAKYSALKPD